MSPVPLPVANTAALTAATASSSTSAAAKTGNDTTTTVNMANSNTSYRQMAQATTNGSGGSATAVATASSTTATNNNNEANKLKMATSSTNSCISAEAAAAAANVTTLQQCDSSSAASTTSENSSSSSSSSALSVKNENCDTVIKTEMENSENCSADSMQQNEANDLQLAAMKHRPILLSSMNPHIICSLCFGYLIDATTIVECLHSFCHSCLIKHLRTEQYCPRCEMMINTAKPNIKPDTTLQAIVYKLVPGLYEKELMRKRAFYKDRPEEAALASPEQRGDDTEHLIFSPSDYMSISLEYADTEELTHSGPEYIELLKPRYLKCPAMCTVAHLKKLVYGKFEINSNRFTIDIMYKVKTIILLDHYTLMDVAYIYTWKRDAPMRFYFRVKQSLRPAIRVKKNLVPQTKKEVPLAEEEATSKLLSQAMCIVHEPTPSIKAAVPETKILEPEEIKQENEAEVSSTTETPPIAAKEDEEPKQFEIVQPPQSPSISSQESNLTDKLKITIVNKAAKEKSSESKTAAKALKEKQKELHKTSPSTSATPKDERKVENIKLKIDLSKQNSVTIINMSDPERKEIVKPVRPEKEWKVTKSKKEKDGSPKSSPKSSPHSERKSKTPSPLTVPPLTIKAERISPLAKLSSPATTAPASPTEKPDEAQKSEFLKSFALTPTKNVKADKPKDQVKNISKDVTLSLIPKPAVKESAAPSPSSSSSKRKSKEPIKAVIKKPKLSPPLATEDFKIKLPPIPASNNQKSGDASATTAATGSESKKPMMPPPAPLAVMKPPSLIKKPSKPAQNKISAAPPGSLTPHPMHNNVQLAAPGSRTPIAKRYQPILPKAARPNPFANIPTDVNKILKDAGTEIKSIPNEPVSSKVYGPKADANNGTLMGPPQMAAPPAKANATNRSGGGSSKNNSNKNNSYLNLALFNASKSKGNEVPPGCRTPMYTPNSPIYSPSSPQYAPNYNIPTMPTYKYTPKPTNPNNSYLQSVLGNNSQMSSLFPSPPVKKDGGSNNSSSNNNSNSTSSSSTNNSNNSSVTSHRAENQAPKRVYPFARSPSPSEDPPEKQLKVKSLLTSCNINIPSSLSITITREDGDPSSNGSAQKHKSPVNNYIEILKLPEQTSSDNSENKRSSPPVAANSLFPNPPVKRVATPPLNATNQPKLLAPPVPVSNMQKSVTANPPAANNRPVAPTNMSVGGKNNGLNKPVASNKPTTPPSSLKSPVTGMDKKGTPSPEKRPMTSPSDQKSPKSPNGDGTGKKFRHILPRQIVAPSTPEVNLPSNKQNGNVIGTYSSPNGANVKIHSNKKVNQSKKSPVSQQQPQQQQQQQQHLSVPPAPPHQPTLAGNLKPPQQSPTNKPQIKAPTKSPQGNRTQKANQAQAQAAAATAKLNPAQNNNVMPTLPPVMPHPMQSMLPPHLGAAAAATNQNELSKFLKENLLRAQVQAAVANQSNMFYPYAANAAAAAQLGQFNPAMFNYQQAYIMDQLSRMQRAGNDAFTEYMQKLKSSMEMPKPVAAVDGSKPCDAKQLPKSASSPKSLTAPQHSPSTSSSGGANSKEQLATKTK